jgi:hypothetical protein
MDILNFVNTCFENLTKNNENIFFATFKSKRIPAKSLKCI